MASPGERLAMVFSSGSRARIGHVVLNHHVQLELLILALEEVLFVNIFSGGFEGKIFGPRQY